MPFSGFEPWETRTRRNTLAGPVQVLGTDARFWIALADEMTELALGGVSAVKLKSVGLTVVNRNYTGAA